MANGYNVCRKESRAFHNLEIFKNKYKGPPELWRIFMGAETKEQRRNPTWQAWVIKCPTLHITDCKDPHFDDLLDNPENYERLV